MKNILVLCLSVCILFACSPTTEQIQKAIEPTQSAIPTSTNTISPTNTSTVSPTLTLTPLPTSTSTVTPTDVQLGDIKVDEILIQYGDLPTGLTGGHISYEAPEMFNELPLADYTIFQQFAKATEVSGGVTVFVYTSLEKIEEAYAKTVEGLGDSTKIVEDIGEKGVISYVSMIVLGNKVEFGDLVFTRCNAVVHVRMTDISDETSLSFYATRLDNRLVELLCP